MVNERRASSSTLWTVRPEACTCQPENLVPSYWTSNRYVGMWGV